LDDVALGYIIVSAGVDTRWIATMAAFQKLQSGNWRALVRRKGTYASETFKRRRDGEEWALETGHRIDRDQSVAAKRPQNVSTFGNLIDLHITDMHEVGKTYHTLRRRDCHATSKAIGDGRKAKRVSRKWNGSGPQ
jgi:hypothetical protein